MATALTFKAPKGYPFKTITIRELTGHDEALANSMATAKGPETTHIDEMIRLSIAKVDGKPVVQPFERYDDWPQKARLLVARGYNEINGVKKEEADVFLKSAVLEEVPEASVRSRVGASIEASSFDPGSE